MDSALVIGGTRFIGRHLVRDLLDHGYDVTVFNRGNHENPFEGEVDHFEGDRAERSRLEAARDEVDPDAVFDCVAYKPAEVRTATDVFADADAYVYISSGAAYGAEEIPKREGVTALEDCTAEQAVDDAGASYGARKAEGDRAVFAAAEAGVNAMAVRPPIVYGPYDYTERLAYWIDRVRNYDRIIVPGDGQNLWQRAYVEDVASALRIVAEKGEAGEAYNVGDRRAVTLAEMIGVIADALDGAELRSAGGSSGDEPRETSVEVVHAGARELSTVDLEPGDFPLYRRYPHLLDTNKLAALGWESTPVPEAMARTVEEHAESGRDGSEHDPGRDAEERLLSVLDTI